MRDKFFFVFFEYFPFLISGYYRTKNQIVRKKIGLVVVSGLQVDNQRLLLLAARDAHIPTTLIHHGVVFETIGFSSHLALTEVEAWGNNECDLLTRLPDGGIEKKNIYITGSPIFDDYAGPEKKEDFRQRLCEKFNLDPEKKIVVIALHHCERSVTMANVMLVGMEWFSFLKMTIQSVEKYVEYQIIIKFHPSDEEFEFHKRMISEIAHSPIPIIRNEESIYNIVHGCDIWISFPSTTIIDAMIMKKAVITVIPTGKEYRNPILAKAGFVVREKEDLELALSQILEKPQVVQQKITDYPEFVYECVYLIDGKSSMRIRDRINHMLMIN